MFVVLWEAVKKRQAVIIIHSSYNYAHHLEFQSDFSHKNKSYDMMMSVVCSKIVKQ